MGGGVIHVQLDVSRQLVVGYHDLDIMADIYIYIYAYMCIYIYDMCKCRYLQGYIYTGKIQYSLGLSIIQVGRFRSGWKTHSGGGYYLNNHNGDAYGFYIDVLQLSIYLNASVYELYLWRFMCIR